MKEEDNKKHHPTLLLVIVYDVCPLAYVVLCFFGISGPSFGVEFGEGDATKQKSLKRSAFSLNHSKAFSE